MTETQHLLAVDIGSSSVRAAVYSVRIPSGGIDGLRAKAGESCDVHESLSGLLPELIPHSARQHVYMLTESTEVESLVQLIEKAVTESLESLSKDTTIHEVALSCFAMNLLGLDNSGKPCTPLMTYAGYSPAIIKASEDLHKELAASGRIDEMRGRTGTTMYHTSYAACQLRAMDPALLEKVHTLVSLPTLLLRRWAENPNSPNPLCSVSLSEASWTGLLNISSLNWDDEARKFLPALASEALPKVEVIPDSSTSGLVAKSSTWQQLGQARFHLGIADGLAANVGSLCVNASAMAVTVGTSAAARILLDRSQVPIDKTDFPPRGLWCYCADRDRVLLGGALTDGGSLYRWVEDMIKLPGDADTKAEACEPGSHGLIVLPFLRGERSMGWNDKAQMTISGITQATQPHEILHAVMEALAVRIGELVEAILNAGKATETRLVASGTALAKSALLQRLLTDVTGKTLYSSRWAREEATSRGVALWALEFTYSRSCDKAADLLSIAAKVTAQDLVTEYIPDASRHQLFKEQIIPKHQAVYAMVF
eukprot:CAMPEP_0171567672 /NCGR_PEP_ID=MMETSP0961-20121227/1297_1 /TAXON_ID=87120 /ORGANISM="Aurantiochytrium limacinum, Strain ATCCMYA-1381" /LENGTH=539 /DNA_ID=CAMNT_0012121633 /DNA_START=176 /DNA_END=1792 /DNA_ORIENTATION=+